MQNYNFDSKTIFGSGELAICSDNGAPVRPVEPEDPGYPADPELLYFWPYRATIALSVIIVNEDIKPVKATISLLDDTDTIIGNLIIDVVVPSGGTLSPIGEESKIFLEHGQKINVYYKDAADESLIKATTSSMNIYDYGHIPPVWVPPLYFGDQCAFGNGESNYFYIDRIYFASDTITKNYTTITRYFPGKACGSNGIISLWAGGYSGQNYIESMPFSTFAFNANWGTLYDGTGYCCGASDTTTFLTAGGYDRQNVIQSNQFASGGSGNFWGQLYQGGKTYLFSMNSRETALWAGGYTYVLTISATEFASQGDSTYWGNLYYSQYYGNATSNDVMGLSYGDANYNSKIVQKHLFDSQGDSTNFGSIGTYAAMYENGAVGNATKALFGADERYSDDLYRVDYAADFSSAFWGNTTYFDGGWPGGASGD